MSFELQPTLRGSLVHLRPLREEDWPTLYDVASDPLVWEQHPSSDRYKEEVFRVFFQEAMESGGALLAHDLKDGKVIGTSRFYGLNPETSEIEIGWTFLARSHWGGKFNGEMKRLMLQHAFQYVNSVLFFIGPNNMRSRKAVEKIGGIFLGNRTNGAGRESVVYRISKDRYLENI
jgi:RimJ/RimL family protein N-acetyltransferase